MKNMLNQINNEKWNEDGFFDYVSVSYGFLHDDDEIDNVGLAFIKKDFNSDIKLLTVFNIVFMTICEGEGTTVTITKEMTRLDDEESRTREFEYYLDGNTIEDIKEEINFLIKYQLDLDIIKSCRVEKEDEY